ncbi:MAG TPA: NAD(P)/FAD-dependent oxidoreductase [Sulfuricurvum sp.]|nr:MAG: pyridine nucleotide-disulfide oxidoreductase [Campylobacterales bacterium 16-40-21]OZA03168.1 MAG: pyridine nucleotide-disulfide oxidoreductase [Sulfuricurvum sp. 17-40-25]HQS67026.1 NAD(P)/FAD-dependent oxidoreductase [Sulfuricurvum sp.]HQT35966.1 NAD(P)/FAD-dependent oxidoreductase [Sulfuricurvum sp.]
MTKIAIIGGGAAGLMASIIAAREGADVTLYEHNQSVGKKILASGNGRCNIINTTATADDYFGTNADFATYALKQLPFTSFVTFCQTIGLLLDIKEDGRCYPLSNEAKSVLNALNSAAKNSGVKILTDTKVTALNKAKEGFIVHTDHEKYTYNKILIATGSEAAPQLGATDDGYRFATAFGHKIIPTYPSLVQLHLNSKIHAKMAGVKTFAEVTLSINGKISEKIQGDILFASYGISGLAILDISQKASLALLNKQNVILNINLLPRFTPDALKEILHKLITSVPDHTLETVLGGLVPAKTVPYLCEAVVINPAKALSMLTPKEISKLLGLIANWQFEVTGTHGFKHAEVSGGGVATIDVDDTTMESKLVKGLYFAGEVLDIVGRRGGYNFNFAWASGMIAGRQMSKK